MLIDTHCHLDAAEFDADRLSVIQAARAGGVGGFLVPAVGASNFDAVAALSAAHPDVVYAVGIHPMYVGQAREPDLDILRERLAGGGAVAVGEIGLDLYVPELQQGEALARQQHFFAEQLKLAADFDLPVMLGVVVLIPWLLDLSLPDSLGIETFCTMFAHAPQVPIIVLTGTDDEVMALHAVKTGAQDYLVKGEVNSNLLLRAMRYAMERKEAERAEPKLLFLAKEDLMRHSAAGITTEAFPQRIKVGGVEYPLSYHFEPGSVRTKTGGPFQVFTPFWRAALALGAAR